MTDQKQDKKLQKCARQIGLIPLLYREIDKGLKLAIEKAKDQPELQRRQIDISLVSEWSLNYLSDECEKINSFLYSLMGDIALLYYLGLGGRSINFGKIPLDPVPDSYWGYTNLCLNNCGLEIVRRDLVYMADHPWETETKRNGLF